MEEKQEPKIFRDIDDTELMESIFAFVYGMNVDPGQFARVMVIMARRAMEPIKKENKKADEEESNKESN